ncbi:hypothetical protein [Streptomyces cylindrosporus]|uniref:Uncharacterized protein n=1 Tax=Streptomyces cylindrosporus TaxID=2927583 RepID=A0ABS9YNX6_9ACTN|nr:hypothetical protein [Streptomyces cylindrosporus]MCI3278306.1 hypothetical protein [Streptomyces cylindrosporus]
MGAPEAVGDVGVLVVAWSASDGVAEAVAVAPDGLLPGEVGLVPGAVGEGVEVGGDDVPGSVTGAEGPAPLADGSKEPGSGSGTWDGDSDAPSGPGDVEAVGGPWPGGSRTVPGFSEGSPGTGSTVLGANGVASRRLSASTPVYAAHSAPAA